MEQFAANASSPLRTPGAVGIMPIGAITHQPAYAARARAFHDSWQFRGGEKFQSNFCNAVAWIEWNPELFPRKYRRFRQAICPHAGWLKTVVAAN